MCVAGNVVHLLMHESKKEVNVLSPIPNCWGAPPNNMHFKPACVQIILKANT